MNSFSQEHLFAQRRALKAIVRHAIHFAGIPVPKRIAGHFCWADPRLFRAEPTEPHVHAWIRRCLSPGDTFFDVGAHYGWMSVTACRVVGRHGRVIAFEAAPALLDMLRYHKAVNRLRQMQIVAGAVCHIESDAVPFHLVNGGLSFSNALTCRDGLPATETLVNTLTLDAYCSSSTYWPDTIKIDVEGAELLVLEGAASVIEQKRPKLIIAVHPPWLPQGQTAEHVFQFLRIHAYRLEDKVEHPFAGHVFGDYLWFPE